jgi:hypothetical protein
LLSLKAFDISKYEYLCYTKTATRKNTSIKALSWKILTRNITGCKYNNLKAVPVYAIYKPLVHQSALGAVLQT